MIATFCTCISPDISIVDLGLVIDWEIFAEQNGNNLCSFSSANIFGNTEPPSLRSIPPSSQTKALLSYNRHFTVYNCSYK